MSFVHRTSGPTLRDGLKSSRTTAEFGVEVVEVVRVFDEVTLFGGFPSMSNKKENKNLLDGLHFPSGMGQEYLDNYAKQKTMHGWMIFCWSCEIELVILFKAI